LRLNRQNRARLYFGLLFLLLVPSFFFFLFVIFEVLVWTLHTTALRPRAARSVFSTLTVSQLSTVSSLRASRGLMTLRYWRFGETCCFSLRGQVIQRRAQNEELRPIEMGLFTSWYGVNFGKYTYLIFNNCEQTPSPWSRVLHEKPVPHLFMKSPASYGNPKIHYHVHKIPLAVHILSQMNPVYASPSHCLKIHFNIIQPLYLGLQSCLFPSGLPTKSLY
jgi:hypothetical protein